MITTRLNLTYFNVDCYLYWMHFLAPTEPESIDLENQMTDNGTEGQTNGRTEGQTDGRTDGQNDKQTERLRDRRTNEYTDGRREKRTVVFDE